MIVSNRNEPAALPRGKILFARGRIAATLLAAGFVAVSSASTKAGFGYFSVDEPVCISNPITISGDVSNLEIGMPLTTLGFHPDTGTPGDGTVISPPNYQFGPGFSPNSSSLYVDPIAGVNNAVPPTTATPPLLIPVPTAISSGLCGLIVLALLATPRWIRRRLF